MSETTTPNVTTHTGMVHRGVMKKVLGRVMLVPACMSVRQIQRMHFSVETTDAITCRHCS